MTRRWIAILGFAGAWLGGAVNADDALPGGALFRLGTPSTLKMHHPGTAAISPDGKQLVFCSGEKSLTIIDPTTSKLLRTLKTENCDLTRQPKFTGDGKCIYCQFSNVYVLLDATSGKQIARIELPPPKSSVTGIFAPFNVYYPSFDGKKLAVSVTGDNNRPIKIWDVLADKSLGEIQPGQNNDGHYCSWSADGTVLAVSGYRHNKKHADDEAANEYVDLWDAKILKRKAHIHAGENAWVIRGDLSPDGKLLAMYCEGHATYQLWSVADNKRVGEIKADFESGMGFPGIYFSPDSKRIAMQFERGPSYVWDCKDLKLQAHKKRNMFAPSGGIGFVPDGDVLAAGSDDTELVIFNLTKSDPENVPITHAKPVFLTAFSKDGKSLYTVGAEQKMIRWDMEAGKATEVVFDVPPQIACNWDLGKTAFSPDHTSFLALSGLGVELFDLNAKEEKRKFLRNQRPFLAHWEVVRFAEDGKSIYAYGTAQEKTVSGNKLESNSYAANWDLTGKVLKEGNGEIDEAGTDYFKQLFKDVKFAPEPQDDTSLPIISTGKEIDDPADSARKLTPITIKSRKDGKVLLEVKLPLQTPRGISISSDQKRVAIPLRDNTVLIYKLP